jgi:ubiquinone/menaquinone biosynthesis C-methylase UbiE
MIFDGYGNDLAQRTAALNPQRVLEIAAGTGIVTHYLHPRLSPDASIMVTDLNNDMLEEAQRKLGPLKNVEFRQADGMALPFSDNTFDTVVCQFGYSFFPDKVAAAREITRVLKPGGNLLFNVWDAIEKNDVFRTTTDALKELLAGDAPTFFEIPFGWYHLDPIRAALEAAGFHSIEISIIQRDSPSKSARNVALGFLTGTPISLELAKQTEVVSLEEAIAGVTHAITEAYGDPPLGAKLQAILVTARAASERE